MLLLFWLQIAGGGENLLLQTPKSQRGGMKYPDRERQNKKKENWKTEMEEEEEEKREGEKLCVWLSPLSFFIIHLGSHHRSSHSVPHQFFNGKNTERWRGARSTFQRLLFRTRGRSAWVETPGGEMAHNSHPLLFCLEPKVLNHSSLRQGPRCSSIYPPSLSLCVCVCLSATFNIHNFDIFTCN